MSILYTLEYDVMKMARYLCDLLLKNPLPLSNHEKNLGQIPVEEHPTKYLTSTPQNCEGHQKQGKSEKLTAKRSLKRHDE